jgi:hypothetical protein
MKSPFPGMDPYLEARWSGLHVALIYLLQESLQTILPSDLRARAEERVLLETIAGDPIAGYRGDVTLVRAPRRAAEKPPRGSTTTIEPVVVEFYDAPEVDRFLQIIDLSNGNRVVSAIEVLSPWNKRAGRLNRDYLRKLADYARAGVSILEIDLLRSSQARLPVGQDNLPAERWAPYLACVRRGWRLPRWELYPIPLREALPAIPVPLRENEPDVFVALQPLIERAYTAGGHDDIDYSKPARPPLKRKDAAWADELLRQAGRR